MRHLTRSCSLTQEIGMSSAQLLKVSLMALVAIALTAGSSTGSAPAVPTSRPVIRLVNRTDRSILVYLDDKFVIRCEPHRTQTLDCATEGEVTGIGRSLCDTWGPKKLQLKNGQTSRWVFREDSTAETSASAAE
jgi:hypothetical protein